jgi:carboxyl-terminal processing protease
MKRRAIYAALIAMLTLNLLVGFQTFYVHAAEEGPDNDPYPNLALLSRVLEMVRQDYVDGDKISYQDLVHGALKGMISTLDPHSEFLDRRKFDELKKDTEGEFGGLGIQVTIRDGVLTIISPQEGTPAFRAGVLANDRIIRIDGRSTEKFSLTDAVTRLRGKPGSEVTITIFRPSTSKTFDVTIKRDVIPVYTVKDLLGREEFPLGENDIGYIRLTQFGEKTAAHLETALEKLEKKGMKALVLDLRNNPGGLLDQAVAVCEKFLPRNQLIVSTEGRLESQKTEYRARGTKSPRTKEKLPMVILVNNGSASASEIVAGCLQDVKRAIVLGEQTFGKGSVQSILPLNDGAALRLTTAKYYTPSHKVIHEKGITPDTIVPMSDDEERAVFLKRQGGLDGLDPEERARLEKLRDVQLDRAMDLLKGVTLFTNREKREAGKVAAN